MLKVVLYGNSLALSGVGASLEARPGLALLRVEARSAATEALCALEPDVVVFDLGAVRPDLMALWKACPSALPIGVDLLTHQALVFSRASTSVLTTDDLLQVIAGRPHSGRKA